MIWNPGVLLQAGMLLQWTGPIPGCSASTEKVQQYCSDSILSYDRIHIPQGWQGTAAAEGRQSAANLGTQQQPVPAPASTAALQAPPLAACGTCDPPKVHVKARSTRQSPHCTARANTWGPTNYRINWQVLIC